MLTEQEILGTVSDPHANAVINIKITHGWLIKLQDNFFKMYQLTHQQFNILRILKGQYPNGVKIKDIKRRMVDKMSNVGRLVEKLQQKDFVQKIEDFNDRRVVFVHLTKAGMAQLTDISANFNAMLSNFDNISEQEAIELVRILEKMRAKPTTKKLEIRN